MKNMVEDIYLKKDMITHGNIIYACFGCFSNTGITAGLGSLEAVKELGLDRVSVGCLAALQLGVAPVMAKTKSAKKIITVDGCPFECSRKILKLEGFKPIKSFILTKDIAMKKKAFDEDIGKNLKSLTDYVTPEGIEKTKRIIINAIKGDL